MARAAMKNNPNATSKNAAAVLLITKALLQRTDKPVGYSSAPLIQVRLLCGAGTREDLLFGQCLTSCEPARQKHLYQQLFE